MDCEKFDRVMLDVLYEELDELTSAAARRHSETCARCGPILHEFRATLEVGALPLEPSPPGLTARILAAEQTARRSLPVRQRLGRAVSMLADYAMRPQLAMAALMLLMIGTSFFLLREKPGDPQAVRVTERGVPESAGRALPLPAEQAAEPLPAKDDSRRGRANSRDGKLAMKAEATASRGADDKPGAEGGGDFELAMAEYRGGNWVVAERAFNAVEKEGGAKAPQAALFSAQALRNASGCRMAGPRFEAVSTRYASASIVNDAHWQAADCFLATGDKPRATKHYRALLGAPGYDERAQRALARLGGVGPRVATKKSGAKAKAAPAKAAPAKPIAPPTPEEATEPKKPPTGKTF